MASTTSGSFTPSAGTADLAKEVGAHVAVIPVAGTAQTINPVPAQQSLTAYNLSAQFVRGTVTLTAGVTAAGAAATRVFLLPPFSTYSLDLGSDDDLAGNIEAIDSVAYDTVAVTATAEVSTLTALTAIPAAAIVVTNFGTK